MRTKIILGEVCKTKPLLPPEGGSALAQVPSEAGDTVLRGVPDKRVSLGLLAAKA